eukprot:scaffold3594_cov133-Isochrysis_galbana.AAC.5
MVKIKPGQSVFLPAHLPGHTPAHLHSPAHLHCTTELQHTSNPQQGGGGECPSPCRTRTLLGSQRGDDERGETTSSSSSLASETSTEDKAVITREPSSTWPRGTAAGEPDTATAVPEGPGAAGGYSGGEEGGEAGGIPPMRLAGAG